MLLNELWRIFMCLTNELSGLRDRGFMWMTENELCKVGLKWLNVGILILHRPNAPKEFNTLLVLSEKWVIWLFRTWMWLRNKTRKWINCKSIRHNIDMPTKHHTPWCKPCKRIIVGLTRSVADIQVAMNMQTRKTHIWITNVLYNRQ
jgi:hypothetical protein